MNYTFKLLVFLLVFSFPLFLKAQQDFQGKAIYKSKTTIDMNNFGNRQLSEEQKKQIAERMKSMLEKTFELTFNRFESVYKEEEKLEAPGQGGGFRMMMGNFSAGTQYKNIKDDLFLQNQEFFGKQFLIKDALPKLEWKMENETKQIGSYTCFKATAIKKVDEFDFRSMRRRPPEEEGNAKEKDSAKAKNPLDEIEIPEEIGVTAWYTPQIPVNQGPGEYWGLPGLILEVSAARTTILCSKIVMNPDEKEELKAPYKGKEVTRKEYAEIVKKKMEEMREMYGGRGRDRGGWRVRH